MGEADEGRGSSDVVLTMGTGHSGAGTKTAMGWPGFADAALDRRDDLLRVSPARLANPVPLRLAHSGSTDGARGSQAAAPPPASPSHTSVTRKDPRPPRSADPAILESLLDCLLVALVMVAVSQPRLGPALGHSFDFVLHQSSRGAHRGARCSRNPRLRTSHRYGYSVGGSWCRCRSGSVIPPRQDRRWTSQPASRAPAW
jgi:hypothetical protein